MRSIQRNLLLWLAVALTAGMAVVMVATYSFAYANITQIFDDELVQIAEAVHLGEDWLGPQRVRIPRPGFNLSVRAYDQRGETYFETVEPSMPPDVQRLFDGGFTLVPTPEGQWRVYTHITSEGVVQVGQPDATRKMLARQLSFRMALPELVLIPLLVLFMAWVLRRGLRPLRHISRRVQERDARRLDPLPTANVPAELLPLIGQINGLLTRLDASMSAHRRFVADAAHELRTPVGAIALQAQVAERTVEPAARAAAFAELGRGVARASRLVEQLLKLAQVAPNVPAPQLRTLDLARLVRDTVGSMALYARRLGVDLGADAAAPAWVEGDESELRSLITNLLDNAVRYAPQHSEVTVAVAVDATGVRMAVTDEGPGIPAAERAAVFERFRRGPGDDTPGVGLGLAIVRAVLERHGGTIALEDCRQGDAMPGLAVVVVLPRSCVPPVTATASNAGAIGLTLP